MLYDYILLSPSLVCLFWSAFLFLNWKNDLRSQKILAFAALLSSLSFLSLAYYVAGVSDFKIYSLLDIIDPSVFLPAIMCLYFKALTSDGPFTLKDYAWFLPPLLLSVTILTLFTIIGPERALLFNENLVNTGSLQPQFSETIYILYYYIGVVLYNWVGLLLFIGICIYALRSILRYHYRLRDFYSVLEDKSITLDYGILIWFLLATVLGVVIFYLQRDFLEKHMVVNTLIFASLSIVSFCLCHSGYRIKYSVEHFASDLKQADGNDSDVTPQTPRAEEPGRHTDLAREFVKLIDEKQIYLHSALRADQVASMLHTNRTYISCMIREELGSNFSDYINLKRIEFSKELMRSHPGMKLSELAEASGFINAPSFCRMFKQLGGGKPPKTWLKELRKE